MSIIGGRRYTWNQITNIGWWLVVFIANVFLHAVDFHLTFKATYCTGRDLEEKNKSMFPLWQAVTDCSREQRRRGGDEKRLNKVSEWVNKWINEWMNGLTCPPPGFFCCPCDSLDLKNCYTACFGKQQPQREREEEKTKTIWRVTTHRMAKLSIDWCIGYDVKRLNLRLYGFVFLWFVKAI